MSGVCAEMKKKHRDPCLALAGYQPGRPSPSYWYLAIIRNAAHPQNFPIVVRAGRNSSSTRSTVSLLACNVLLTLPRLRVLYIPSNPLGHDIPNLLEVRSIAGLPWKIIPQHPAVPIPYRPLLCARSILSFTNLQTTLNR